MKRGLALPSKSGTVTRRSNPFSKYQTDPCGYAREVLKLRLTPDQELFLQSIVENRRTNVMASHAIGKTFGAAIAANWWFDCWDEHIVYVTGPSWAQALGLTFKQIRVMRRERQLPGRILDTGWVYDEDPIGKDKHFIRAINAERGEGFQGEHIAPLLIVLEEAVGVPNYIWEAARGLMTEEACRQFAIGNPTDESTNFGTACSAPGQTTFSISVLNHPNIVDELQCLPPPFPGAARLLWLREMLEEECQVVPELIGDAFSFYPLEAIDAALKGKPADPEAPKQFYLPNAVFQGRVLGIFPTQADEQVIPRGWLANLPVLVPNEAPEIGSDQARFGSDRTTIAIRCGSVLLSVRELRQIDQALVTDALKDAAQEAASWRADKDPKKVPIKLDVTGGLGTGPHDFLKREGYTVEGVNASSSAQEGEKYPNRRSELWFATRERARTKNLDLSRLPKDLRERLIRELSAPKWKLDSAGRKVVEQKDKIKDRLGESPDLADGVNLAFSGKTKKSIRF